MKKITSEVFFSFELEDNMPKEPIHNGQLIIDPVNGMKLTFSENKFPDNDDINKTFNLYGQTIDGQKFTVNNCFQRSSGGEVLEDGILFISSRVFIIDQLFMGEWIEDIGVLKIKNIHVRFSYFEHWLPLLQTHKTPFGTPLKEFLIPIKQFKSDFNVTINNNLNIGLTHSLENITKGNKKFIFDSRRYLKLNYPNEITINDALKDVFVLWNLFKILLSKKQVFTEELSFFIDNQEVVIYRNPIDYLPEKSSVSERDFLDVFNDENSAELFIKWFELCKKYKRIFDLLFTTLNNKSNDENKFLSLVQWIEGFCRVKFPTSRADKDKHKDKIENIKNNLEGNDLGYFEKITQYPYETNLINQLKNIIRGYEIIDIIGVSDEKLVDFFEKIKQHRNKITHAEKQRKNDDYFIEIMNLSLFLENLIYIILINELSINKDSHAYTEHIKKMKFYYSKIIKNHVKKNNNQR